MARMAKLVSLAALTFAVTGCVSQEKYNALKLDRDRLTEQLNNADRQLAEANANSENYRRALEALKNGGDANAALLANAASTEAELRRQLDEMNRKYSDAIGMVGRSGTALPPVLTSALSDFAAQNPDLVEFDAGRGMVKFRSDLTFALGSAAVTPQAKQAIARFCQILNSPAAAGYELLVAGHTDNIPVSNPATKQAGHKDNWYLSAHRALEVGGELRGNGVNGQRLGCIGYADQRPVADNGSDSGRSKNRRVEVLILPNQVGTRPTGGNTGNANARPAAKPVLNKDTANIVDDRPMLNK